MSTRHNREILHILYEKLYRSIGPLNWWPADSPFEVIIGAILTQNTAWTNVEKAITALKEKTLLHPRRLYAIREKTLAGAIRSSGFFNLKAKRIRSFLRFLFRHYRGDLARMFAEETATLRGKLLRINGLGPETVDSILLYAGEKPVFVVDAYTRRILLRHRLISEDAGYEEIQKLFMENLESDVRLFNEYHALIVYVGKHFCRPVQNCGPCPLRGLRGQPGAARRERAAVRPHHKNAIKTIN
jgi:endonuclease-3 related protein